MADLRIVKPSTPAQRATQTTTDTWEVTKAKLEALKLPPFQRQLRHNDKLADVAKKILEDDGVIPGVFLIGVLNKEYYLIDGQHRSAAFVMSGCPVGFVDVRIMHFDDMASMGEEFVNVNSAIARFKPDDILRGLEGSNANLGRIRRKCPYIGYDNIRRNEKSPIVSMSAVLRCWFASVSDIPSAGGLTATSSVRELTDDDASKLITFMDLAMTAWGKAPEYHRLWLNLNLTLCMWLYRRLVIGTYSAKTPRVPPELFTTLLMSLSADKTYIPWLLGRQLNDRDRSPCYSHIKRIFAHRYEAETSGKKSYLPQPDWAASARAGARKR